MAWRSGWLQGKKSYLPWVIIFGWFMGMEAPWIETGASSLKCQSFISHGIRYGVVTSMSNI